MWCDICGYEGLYQISNTGKVKSLVGWNGHEYVERDKIIKQTLTTTGYYKVELSKNGKRKSKKVHRLIAEAFISNTEGKPNINHKDGNPLNNKIENLEWCTQRENVIHAIETGLKKTHNPQREDIARKYVEERKTTKQIAAEFNTTETVIRNQLHKASVPLGERRVKYCLPFAEIQNEIKNGERICTIAEKYNCPSNLISALKYKWKKGGILE